MRALSVGLFAVTLAASTGQAAGASAALTLSACQVAGGKEVVRCGRVQVPENWDRPEGRQIFLHVIVLPQLGPGPEQAPMIWLDGGPGVAGTSTAALYTGELKLHRERRAVVMFDQRGTGESGALHCPPIERQSPLSDPWTASDLVSCRRTLEAGADLAQYSTLAATRDLDAVRSALGYEKVDLAALSYGTLLAQTYMRLYPSHVRSAALIGTVPLDEKLPLHHSANAEHVLRQVFDDCRMDAACHSAFPRLASEWALLQERLSQGPIAIKAGEDMLVARKGPFDDFIRGLLTTPDGQRRLPFLISRAARGDYSVLVGSLAARGPDSVAEGLYLSVTCPEATRRIRPAEIAPAVVGSSFGRYRVDQQIAACRLWAPATVDAALSAPLRSDIPVLLLSGGRDATTPVDWARRVAAGLPNSSVLVFDHMTHLPIGLENVACVDQLMDAFFAKASSRGLNASCRLAMTPPPFAVAPR